MIDPDLSVDTFVFNLTAVNLPDREIVASDIGIRGRQIPMPTGVATDAMIVTCSYMLSSNWMQYRFLSQWFDLFSNGYHGMEAKPMDISLFILSEYKQPMFYVTFVGSWLNHIGGVNMNYQDGYNEIQASFSFRYAYMDFDNFPEL
jgi:hypothetical protein